MKLTHIGISNFRSIGEELLTIDLTKKINVFVGANNCGKSNVLRALEFLGTKAENRTFGEIDRHHRRPDLHPSLEPILIDSDRRKNSSPLNPTKLRVQQQCATE